jgi:IPTL-CTERM motif
MTSLSRVLLFAVVAFVPANTWAAPQIFFGEDLAQVDDERLLSHPIADAARAQFLSNLSSFATEDFESFQADRLAPLPLNFGAFGSATLQDVGVPPGKITEGVVPGGLYPISGTKFWESRSNFSITFSQPQVAFGFYAVDVGDFDGQLTITYLDGSSRVLIVPNTHSLLALGGSVLYFAFIDTANPFTMVSFDNTSVGTGIFDIFGFDDLTVGAPQQVVVAGIPTLTEWGMAFMFLFLALTAVFFLRRQRSEVRLG